MRDQDLVALIDACLDDKLKINEMVKEIRNIEYTDLISAMNMIVYGLKKSTHQEAIPRLEFIKQNFTHFNHITIPTR